MGPWGPLEQSPFGDSFKHASTAFWSCNLDCGANAVGDRVCSGGRGGCDGGAVAVNHKHGRAFTNVLQRTKVNIWESQAERKDEIGALYLRTHRYKNSARGV